MFSDFLTRVLNRSYHEPDGCGMSIRPEYYSGRGANPGDLRPESLEKIYQAIQKHVNKNAADAFAQMVQAIPRLTATDFLIALACLEQNLWTWKPTLLGNQRGLYAGTFEEAAGTVVSALMGMNEQDDTVNIRRAFLKLHNLDEPRKQQNGIDNYGCEFAPCTKLKRAR